MKLTMNILNDTPIRQEGLKTLRSEVKKRFPQTIPEEILLLLMDRPTFGLINKMDDLIGYVRFKEVILIEINKEQPLILDIENHHDLLRLSEPLQKTLQKRFALLLGG
tara:strand:- start:177 stop:500 length:324 start_codon:yes stop_codon:yes gene_type:complete